MTTHSRTLAEALPEEISRVEEIIKIYDTVPGGELASVLMKDLVERAKQATLDGDTVAMLRTYNELIEWSM